MVIGPALAAGCGLSSLAPPCALPCPPCSQVVLERAIAEYRKRHPDANDEKLIKHIIKYSLPSTLPNTPSWHRRNLQDLLALVDRWGLPTHFLTLTADEFSTSRWEEVETLEDMVRK